MVQVMEWELRALTNIWTGDARRNGDRLIPTGIMGSLRWWYEVLVRGLGGKACDPTAKEVRCPQDSRKKPTDPGHHCVVCELFGCTGWARKFRLMVLDKHNQVIQDQIHPGQEFVLYFVPLRPIAPEEWSLLDATLRLIADYGAIGGKMVFKPSDEPNRQNKIHHRDFGLVEYVKRPEGWQCTKTLEEIKDYVTDSRWRKNFDDSAFVWASLQNFWCVKGRYLARQDADTSSFNFVIGRPEAKNPSSQADSWLAGRRPDRRRGIEPEGKKVFSFKEPERARRTFGFVQNRDDFLQILQRLETLRDGDGSGRRREPVWEDFDPQREFIKGERILEHIFLQEERA